MNTINDLHRQRQGGSPSACPPDPCMCSACGQLECLCRPRFFAGQILTADDLNRLDGYIRGKQRLHNRQLHGWGVVNGLEVTCNPCGSGVAVGCGYALSPCGEDIVVCESVSVDVCALIKRCCTDKQWHPCQPPRAPRPPECDAEEQEWILAIRYSETPARGVKPLRTPDCTNGCSCGCGGGAGCSCGCNATAPAKKPRGAPVQCEATVVCEGFAFEVYRKPTEQDDPERRNVLNPDSELVKRFQCCVEMLITQAPPLPGPLQVPATSAAAAAWFQWIHAMRAQLRRYFASHGSYNCELRALFDTIPFPPAGTLQHAGAIFLATVLLLVVWMDALFNCFCSALLPPCPPPTQEARVPLASIHVTGSPCRVQRICNWSVHRKFATTFPALQYWLSLFPFGMALRRLMETICCFDVGAILRGIDVPRNHDRFARGAHAADDGGGQGGDAQQAWQRATERLNPGVDEAARIAAARTLLTAALGRTNQMLDFGVLAEGVLRSGQEGKQLGAAEVANLPQFFAANQLLRPVAGAALPPALGMLASLAAGAGQDDVSGLREELAALKASVQAQAAEIDHLKQANAARGKRKPRHE